MDIILCHPSLRYKGGAERAILEIAKRFNPVIYTADSQDAIGFPEFREFDVRELSAHPAERAISLASGSGRVNISLRAGLRYFFHKFREDYDLINAQVVPSEWIRNRNPRVCWYCHSPVRAAYDLYGFQVKPLGFPQKQVMDAYLSAYRIGDALTVPRIEKICTNSEISNARIKKYLGRNDAEVVISGVDYENFECAGYEKFFFYPSRIIPEKRMEMAIEAFSKFAAGGGSARKGWKLILAGGLSDSARDRKYFDYLKGLCKATGGKVQFRANLTDAELKRLYATCYSTLFCAIEEDWGLIPPESMSASKPCISVNEGGPMYSIIDGKTGFLVNSTDEMAEKMKFLADHPNICEKMGKAGRKRVEQNYGWKRYLDQLEHAFKETSKM